MLENLVLAEDAFHESSDFRTCFLQAFAHLLSEGVSLLRELSRFLAHFVVEHLHLVACLVFGEVGNLRIGHLLLVCLVLLRQIPIHYFQRVHRSQLYCLLVESRHSIHEEFIPVQKVAHRVGLHHGCDHQSHTSKDNQSFHFL